MDMDGYGCMVVGSDPRVAQFLSSSVDLYAASVQSVNMAGEALDGGFV